MSQDDIKRVNANLAGVSAGLEQVIASVKGAGFEQALPGYRQMKIALLQQRLWSLSHMTPDMAAHWDDISVRAKKAGDILASFAEVLHDISQVAQMTGIAAGQEAAPSEALEETESSAT